MPCWNINEGDLVRIRRKGWSDNSGEIGTVIRRTYLAYDPANCKWQVLVDNDIKEFQGKNLFPLYKNV